MVYADARTQCPCSLRVDPLWCCDECSLAFCGKECFSGNAGETTCCHLLINDSHRQAQLAAGTSDEQEGVKEGEHVEAGQPAERDLRSESMAALRDAVLKKRESRTRVRNIVGGDESRNGNTTSRSAAEAAFIATLVAEDYAASGKNTTSSEIDSDGEIYIFRRTGPTLVGGGDVRPYSDGSNARAEFLTQMLRHGNVIGRDLSVLAIKKGASDGEPDGPSRAVYVSLCGYYPVSGQSEGWFVLPSLEIRCMKVDASTPHQLDSLSVGDIMTWRREMSPAQGIEADQMAWRDANTFVVLAIALQWNSNSKKLEVRVIMCRLLPFYQAMRQSRKNCGRRLSSRESHEWFFSLPIEVYNWNISLQFQKNGLESMPDM